MVQDSSVRVICPLPEKDFLFYFFSFKWIEELKVIGPLILIISTTDLGLGKLVKPCPEISV